MIAGVILAGGDARRMGGGDKTLLDIGGASVLARIAGLVSPQVDHLAISANGDPARFGSSGLAVLADDVAGLGPLGGILRALGWASSLGCEVLLSVPGDTPFLPADLVRRLWPAPAVACSGRVHHTVALWPTPCRAKLARHLASGSSRSVRAFAETLGVRSVAFEARDRDPFFNINRPEDLERARLLAGAPSSPDRPAG